MKHTQGKLSQNSRGVGADIYFRDEQNRVIITVHSLLCQGDTTEDLAEQQANAELISEAFETGKSPAQLAARLKEVEEQMEAGADQYAQAMLNSLQLTKENKALVELNKELVEGIRRFVKMVNGSNFYFKHNRLEVTLNGQRLLNKAERINK